ncbi:hypothetical protein [Cupriavidus sp. 8B]
MDQIDEDTYIRTLSALSDDVHRGDITQLQLSRATGVDQSQISRLLAGKGKTVSRAGMLLFAYKLDKDTSEARPDPGSSIVLMEAISEVWDGTQAGARRLAHVIRALAVFRDQEL